MPGAGLAENKPPKHTERKNIKHSSQRHESPVLESNSKGFTKNLLGSAGRKITRTLDTRSYLRSNQRETRHFDLLQQDLGALAQIRLGAVLIHRVASPKDCRLLLSTSAALFLKSKAKTH